MGVKDDFDWRGPVNLLSAKSSQNPQHPKLIKRQVQGSPQHICEQNKRQAERQREKGGERRMHLGETCTLIFCTGRLDLHFSSDGVDCRFLKQFGFVVGVEGWLSGCTPATNKDTSSSRHERNSSADALIQMALRHSTCPVLHSNLHSISVMRELSTVLWTDSWLQPPSRCLVVRYSPLAALPETQNLKKINWFWTCLCEECRLKLKKSFCVWQQKHGNCTTFSSVVKMFISCCFSFPCKLRPSAVNCSSLVKRFCPALHSPVLS